MLQAGLGVRGY